MTKFMPILLLALRDEARQRELETHLQPHHRLITLNQVQSDTSHAWNWPHLSVVDLASWPAYQAWRDKQTTLYTFPSLLVLDQHTGEALEDVAETIQTQVDDVIRWPAPELVLRKRIDALLRLQGMSYRQARAAEQLTTTHKALEAASDAILLVDTQGTSLYHNPAFTSLFGFTVAEINVGGIPNLLFTRADFGTTIFAAASEKGSWRGEIELMNREGRAIPTFLRIDRIDDDRGQTLGFVSICTDVTNQRRVIDMQREQRALSEALRDTAAALTSTLDFNEVLRRILNNIARVVPNDAASIILIDEDQPHLMLARGYDHDDEIYHLRDDEMSIADFADLHAVLQTGEPYVVSDTRQFLLLYPSLGHHTPWLASHITSPIILQDEIIGFVTVDSSQSGFYQAYHAERLQLFVEQAAIAIQNARFHEQSRSLAALEERQRLARNLHDAVSQTLFSAGIIAESLQRLWTQKPERIPDRLEQLHHLTRGALANMRSLLLELHPERLLQTSLNDLLQQLADGLRGQTNVEVVVTLDEGLNPPPDVHTALYYIAQEALNNVVKHAYASRIDLSLRHLPPDEADQDSPRGLRLIVRDDGRGFDPQQVKPSRLGLNIMRQRAEAISARFHAASVPGQGTTITLDWRP